MTSIPEEIFHLTELLELDLSLNELKDVPEEISALSKLNKLYINNNRLAVLAESLGYDSCAELIHGTEIWKIWQFWNFEIIP